MAWVQNIVIEVQQTVTPFAWVPFYCAKDGQLQINADVLKITDTVNGQFNKILPVGVSGSMSLNSLIRLDSTFGLPEVADKILNSIEVTVSFTMTDTNGVIKRFTSNGYITALGAGFTVFSLGESAVTITLSGLIQLV